jgi:hypothetical protein
MASCKVSPIVRVERVDISDFRSVEVSVSIEGATSTLIKDENLSQYITAVCVLSIYDPGSSNSVEAVLESKAHWKDDEWYKNARGWDAYLRADKFDPAAGYTTFDIDLSDIVKGGTIQTDDGKALWNETYLSYFTYIQVDTQKMEEVKRIPIPDEYIGMSGDYETGVILIDGVMNSEASFEIVDSRHAESYDTNGQC